MDSKQAEMQKQKETIKQKNFKTNILCLNFNVKIVAQKPPLSQA